MLRNDWYIATFASTSFVGILHVLANQVPALGLGPASGLFALCVCYIVSLASFMLRAFYKLPPTSSLAEKPIRSGMRVALYGGGAYAACMAAGVAIAYEYVGQFAYFPLETLLLTVIAVTCFGGLIAVPIGFLAGVVYTMHRAIASRIGDENDGEH